MTPMRPSTAQFPADTSAPIHRFPKLGALRIVQVAGKLIGLRLIVASDAARMAEYLGGLSDRSRSLRFLSSKRKFTTHEIDKLVAVDQRHHVAWQAYELSAPTQPIIGEARFVRLATDAADAEFAVSVTDAYQGHGLGKIILETLAQTAQDLGVAKLHGYVRADNGPMLGFLSRRGAKLRRDYPGILKADLPVDAFMGSMAHVA